MNMGDKFQGHLKTIIEYYNVHGATVEDIKKALESELKEIELITGGKRNEARNGYRRLLSRSM